MAITRRGLKACTTAKYNILAELEEVKMALQSQCMTVGYMWVQGHQDENNNDDKLSRESLLNVDADLRAGMFRADPLLSQSPCPCPPQYLADSMSLMIGPHQVTKHIAARARHAYSLKAMRIYLMEQNKWCKEVFDSVDWSCMEAALDAKSHDMRVCVAKFMHEWLNMGTHWHCINARVPDSCPYCGQPRECGVHLLTCSAPNMKMS